MGEDTVREISAIQPTKPSFILSSSLPSLYVSFSPPPCVGLCLPSVTMLCCHLCVCVACPPRSEERRGGRKVQMSGETQSCMMSSWSHAIHLCTVYVCTFATKCCIYCYFNFFVVAENGNVLGEGLFFCCSFWSIFHFFPVGAFSGTVFPCQGPVDRGCCMLYRL